MKQDGKVQETRRLRALLNSWVNRADRIHHPTPEMPPVEACLRRCADELSALLSEPPDNGCRVPACPTCREEQNRLSEPQAAQEQEEKVHIVRTMAEFNRSVGFSYRETAPDTANEYDWRADALFAAADALAAVLPAPPEANQSTIVEDKVLLENRWRCMQCKQSARSAYDIQHQKDCPNRLIHSTSAAPPEDDKP